MDQPNKFITEIFAHARTIEISGNSPCVCSEDALYAVTGGSADLFYIKPEGGLMPLGSFAAGEVFCATGGLQIGGREGTSVLALPLENLEIAAPLMEPFLEHYLSCADRLIRFLSSQLPDGVSYDGAGAALGPGGVLRCSGKPGLIRVEGDGDFCGVLPVESTMVLPFTRGSWLQSSGLLDILAAEPDNLSLRQSLLNFARFLCTGSGALCKRQSQQWQDSAAGRKESDRQIFSNTLTSLAGVMDSPSGQMDCADELSKICARIAGESGICLQSQALVKVESVEEFATRFNCRIRRVKLEGDWFHHDSGSFAGFHEGRPVALLAQGDGYRMEHADGTSHRLTAQLAEGVEERGWSFFQSLPPENIGRLDILRLACRGSGRDLILVLLIGIATGLLGMVSPALTGTVVNQVIPSGSETMMMQLALCLMVAAISGSLFSLVQNFCLLRFSQRSSFRMQASIWDRLLNLPASFFGRYDAGDLANRAMGIDAIRQILSQQVLSTALAVVVGMFNIIIAFLYSWQLSLVVIAFSIVGSLSGLALSFFQLRYQRQVQEISGKLSGMVLQFITAIAKIRVAGAESRAFSRWSTLFCKQKRSEFEYSIFSQLSSMLFSFLPLMQTALTFYIISTFDEEHRLSTGSYMAFSAASAQVAAAMGAMASMAVAMVQAIPHYERATPILQQKPEPQLAAMTQVRIKGGIEARNIDFAYADGAKVLSDVSIKAEPGEFIAVVGPSGSGKSTLLKILLGLEMPQKGAVLFDGAELATFNLKNLRNQFGVVLQDGGVMQGTIFTNVCGAKQLTRDEAWDALKMAGLQREVEAMPMGLHTVMSQGGGGLSGGQRQRLLIARALAGNPRILFFDEATSALDNTLQAEVTKNISGLNLTRIVIAHRLSTIRNADRIYVMENGQVVQSGTFQRLLEDENGLFHRLSSRQMI